MDVGDRRAGLIENRCRVPGSTRGPLPYFRGAQPALICFQAERYAVDMGELRDRSCGAQPAQVAARNCR